MFVQIFQAVGGLLLVAGAIYGFARWVGLGRCMDCGRLVPPWEAYCTAHGPDSGGDPPGA